MSIQIEGKDVTLGDILFCLLILGSIVAVGSCFKHTESEKTKRCEAALDDPRAKIEFIDKVCGN